jgi:RNA-directed DNA polymerase
MFENITSVENLLEAWREFLPGKRGKRDVQEFQLRLMDNILSLHKDLISGAYKHGSYEVFNINDPKPRSIHKATVRDRLLHHAIHRILCPFFDKKFIADSFSCRVGKGTYAAINRFRRFSYIVGKNNTQTCWVLKCDVRKFFASINQSVLVAVLKKHIQDADVIQLLQKVIGSFSSAEPGIGLPLGNLTSQLFVNIYMNEFDQFVKHKLKARYYIRYTDDFVILSESRERLETLIPLIKNFLEDKLRLTLHPDKVFIKTLASGVDFLGWVNFPNHRVIRVATERRMMKNIALNPRPEVINSYIGLLSHGNARKLEGKVMRITS